MEAILILALLGAGLFWFFKRNTESGRRFVRAYLFLELLESGSSVQEANSVAKRMYFSKYSDGDADTRAIHRARAYAAHAHAGKQLPVIAMAVAKGFQG